MAPEPCPGLGQREGRGGGRCATRAIIATAAAGCCCCQSGSSWSTTGRRSLADDIIETGRGDVKQSFQVESFEEDSATGRVIVRGVEPGQVGPRKAVIDSQDDDEKLLNGN